MILVIVSEIAFHLGRVHAAVRLGDIDSRVADLREDVDGHALEREDGTEGDGDERHHYCKWPAKRREDESHRSASALRTAPLRGALWARLGKRLKSPRTEPRP